MGGIAHMKADEARQVICDQDRLGRERLGLILVEMGNEAKAMARNVVLPWQRYESESLPTEAQIALAKVERWYRKLQKRLTELVIESDELMKLVVRGRVAYTGSGVGPITHTNMELIALGNWFTTVSVTWPLLKVPGDVHPPRHARIGDGVLVRLLNADLSAQAEEGRMISSLVDGAQLTGQVFRWFQQTATALENVKGARSDFLSIAPDRRTLGSIFPDPKQLHLAYLTLGLTYLHEVIERMSDYAEASRPAASGPQISVNITGGTFNGSQFAASIVNINSAITDVRNAGHGELATALDAIAQAALTHENLACDQREELLEQVGYLAEAAKAPPEKRSRSIIKAILTSLQTAAASGSDLGKAMDAWGSVLHRLS